MLLPRRALLAVPLLVAARPAGAREEPPAAAPALLPHARGLVALTWPGRGAVLLPAGARPLRRLSLAGLSLLALALPVDARLVLLALCGADDAGPRLLALDILHWRGADGAHLDTRYAEVTDRRRIALRRELAIPRDRLHWRRAQWTDYLRWAPPRLVDAPVRPPPAGSWQASLDRRRLRTLHWLATPRTRLRPADIVRLGLSGDPLGPAGG